jgi:hypothetical protein
VVITNRVKTLTDPCPFRAEIDEVVRAHPELVDESARKIMASLLAEDQTSNREEGFAGGKPGALETEVGW